MPTKLTLPRVGASESVAGETGTALSIFLGWELLRIPYNLLLLVPLLRFPFPAPFSWLALLNLGYFGGACIEILLLRLHLRSRAVTPILYVTGTAVSVCVLVVFGLLYEFMAGFHEP
jgi:hypothetical protein